MTGVAEITVKPTWGGVTARSLIATIEDIFMPLLRTLDLSDPIAVRRALDKIPENLAAKALIDNACWDLYAAQLGRPLWQHWGGQSACRSFLGGDAAGSRSDGHGGSRDGRTSRLSHAQGQGRAGPCRGRGRYSLKFVQHSVKTSRLYVDANGAYPPDQAADYSRAIADAGAMVMEDPCPLNPDADFDDAAKQHSDSAPGRFRLLVAPRCDAVPFARCAGAECQARAFRTFRMRVPCRTPARANGCHVVAG